MDKKYLNIAVIISFLMITINGGTLTLMNFLWIIVGVFGSIVDLTCVECGQIEALQSLILLLFTIASLFFVLSKKKNLNLIGVGIQYFYLFHSFKIKHLEYWYYTLPTSIYLIPTILKLSLFIMALLRSIKTDNGF